MQKKHREAIDQRDMTMLSCYVTTHFDYNPNKRTCLFQDLAEMQKKYGFEAIDEGDISVSSEEGRETERFRPEKSFVTLGLRVESDPEDWEPEDDKNWRETERGFVKV